MVNSRNKGAAFERVIVNKINTVLESKGIDTRVKRNLDQYQTKGMADVYWDKFAIECKRYKANGKKTMYKNDWWKQAVESAGDNLIPILIYKYDRRDIMCVIPLFLVTSVDAPNWECTYLCPLSEICERLNEILQKADGFKQLST
jgi:hypothetical protein